VGDAAVEEDVDAGATDADVTGVVSAGALSVAGVLLGEAEGAMRRKGKAMDEARRAVAGVKGDGIRPRRRTVRREHRFLNKLRGCRRKITQNGAFLR
jgi:hypothetical protein